MSSFADRRLQQLLLLLVIFCCLMPGTWARPASGSSDRCSLECPGRSFWTGFEPGYSYEYDFEHSILIGSGLSEATGTRMAMAGKATVEVHDLCELVLRVQLTRSQASASASSPDTLVDKAVPDKVAQGLAAPLRFAFENGRVAQVCPGAEETRASLNLKRGILSHLHLAIDSRRQGAAIREVDVLGDCWTTYSSDGRQIVKSKDLAKCTGHFEVFPRKGVKSAPGGNDASWAAVTKGNARCTIKLDDTKDMIKEAECQESRVLDSNAGDSSKSEKVEVLSKVKLARQLDSVGRAVEDIAIAGRADLRHQHKSADECQDADAWTDEDVFHRGNECLEKKLPESGRSSSDFLAAANRTIQALCSEASADGMKNTTAKTYAQLLRSLRGITDVAQLNQLYNWVNEKYCKSNELLRIIVFGAFPNIGTQASVELMLQQLQISTLPGQENWLANGIALMQTPTPFVIGEVLKLVLETKFGETANVKHIMALSSVTARYCDLNPDCESEEIVRTVIEEFSSALGQSCANARSEKPGYAYVSLAAIGNIGRVAGGAGTLLACANNTELPLSVRTVALRSLRRFSSLTRPEKFRLISFVANASEDSELRIVAYKMAAQFADQQMRTDESVINQLKDLFTSQSEDVQVQSYVYSHLSRWLRKQQGATDSGSIASILRNYARHTRKNQGLGYSKQIGRQFSSEMMRSTFELESDIIYSSKSFLPRSVNLNMTVESPLSGEAINMFELGVRMEGMESLLLGGEEASNTPSNAGFSLNSRQSRFQQQEVSRRITIYQRRLGMELDRFVLDRELISGFLSMASVGDPAIILQLLQDQFGSLRELSKPKGKMAGTLTESTLSIPTMAGFPILLKKEQHYVTDISFDTNFDFKSMTDISARLQVKPSASVYLSRTVSVDAAFERAGVESSSSVLTSTGLELSLTSRFKSKNDIDLSFKVDPLKKEQKIIDLKTDVVFFSHDGERSIVRSPVIADAPEVKTLCSSDSSISYLGRKICVTSSYNGTFTPTSFVRQIPGTLRVSVEMDDSFGQFEATIRHKNVANRCQLLLVLGDQASSTRLLKANFTYSKSGGSRNIDLELANPFLPVRWSSSSQTEGAQRAVTADLTLGTIEYKFVGSRSISAGGPSQLRGNFSQAGSANKVGVVVDYAFAGWAAILPLARLDVDLQFTGDRLIFKNSLLPISESGSRGYSWNSEISHKRDSSDVSSAVSVLDIKSGMRGGRKTCSFIYNTKIVNMNGQNVDHSFSAVANLPGDSSSEKNIDLRIIHDFKYVKVVPGSSREISLLGCDVSLNLRDHSSGSLLDYRGGGTAKFGNNNATLSDLRFTFGQMDAVDSHSETRGVTLSYGAEYNGNSSRVNVVLQSLPRRKWSLVSQCFAMLVNVSRQEGAAWKQSVAQLRHTVDGAQGGFPTVNQIALVKYRDQNVVNIRHRLQGSNSADGKRLVQQSMSFASAATNNYSVNCNYTIGNRNLQRRSELRVNDKVVFRMASLLTYSLYRSVPMSIEMHQNWTVYENSSYSIVMRSAVSERTGKNIYNFQRLLYQIISGRRVSVGEVGSSLWKLVSELQGNRTILFINPAFTTRLQFQIDLLQNGSECFSGEVKIATKTLTLIQSVALTGSGFGNWKSKKLNLMRSYKLVTSSRNIGASWNNNRNNTLETRFSISSDDSRNSNSRFSIPATFSAQLAMSYNMAASGGRIGDVKQQHFNSQLNITRSKRKLGASYGLSLDGSKRMDAAYSLTYTKRLSKMNSTILITNSIEKLNFNEIRSEAVFETSAKRPFYMATGTSVNKVEMMSLSTEVKQGSALMSLKTRLKPLQEVTIGGGVESMADGKKFFSADAKFVSNDKEFSYQERAIFVMKFKQDGKLFFSDFVGNTTLKGYNEMIEGFPPSLVMDYRLKLEILEDWQFESIANFWRKNGLEKSVIFKGLVKYKKSPLQLALLINTPYGGLGRVGFNASMERSENSANFDVLVALPLNAPSELRLTGQATPEKQQIVLNCTSRSAKLNIVTFSHDMKMESETVIGNMTVSSSLGELQGSSAYIWGDDKYIGWRLSIGGMEKSKGGFVYLPSGKSYPQVQHLSVSGANLGAELAADGASAYLLRSGAAASRQWQLLVKSSSGEEKAAANVQMSNGRVTSGTGSVMGTTINFSATEAGSMSITVGSEGGANTVTWTSADNSRELTFKMGDKESCFKYEKSGTKMEVKYGACKNLNALTVDSSFTGTSLTTLSGQLTIQLTKPEGRATQFHLLPGYSLNIDLVSPFSYTFMVSDSLKKFKEELTSENKMLEKFLLEYDLTDAESYSYNFEIVSSKPEVYSARVNKSLVMLEVENYFMVQASWRVAESINDATQCKVLELKGSFDPSEIRNPHSLKMWIGDIAGGKRSYIEAMHRDGRQFTVTSDSERSQPSENEFRFAYNTSTTNSLMPGFRSSRSVTQMSFKRDMGRYTVQYNDSLTVNSTVWYSYVSTFKGSGWSMPTEAEIALPTGYIVAKMNYSIGSYESRFYYEQSKYFNKLDSYSLDYRVMDISIPYRDFTFDFRNPSRQFYVSHDFSRAADAGPRETRIEFYLNKRMQEGVVVTLTEQLVRESSGYLSKRKLELELPTRTIGFDRSLRNTGKIDYNLTVFWEAEVTNENSVRADLTMDFSQPSSYYQRLRLRAPFIKNDFVKQFNVTWRENGFSFRGSSSNEPADLVTVNVDYQKYWNRERNGYQSSMNVTMRQRAGNKAANFTIFADSICLLRSRHYSQHKYMTEYRIYTKVPSESIDSFMRIRSVPFEEFTIACNHGATLSFRLRKMHGRSRLTMFVSNSEKRAAQLTIARDWRMSTLMATLDTGSGYMNPHARLSIPFYEPERLLVKASAGLSRCGTKVHVGILSGNMSANSRVSLWKPEEIPSNLGFFFAGLKLGKDNTLNYLSHWRILTSMSPFTFAKTALVDPWSGADKLPFGTETINNLIRGVEQSHRDNVDNEKIVALLQDAASSDMDKLKAWASSAQHRNDFFCNSVAMATMGAYRSLYATFYSWMDYASSLNTTTWVPAFDRGIMSAISDASQAFVDKLNSIPVAQFWSAALSKAKESAKAVNRQLIEWLSAAEGIVRRSVSSATGGASSSLQSFYTRLLPTGNLSSKLTEMFTALAEAKARAVSCVFNQLVNSVFPYGLAHGRDVQNAYETAVAYAREFNQWRKYLKMLRQRKSATRTVASSSFVSYSFNAVDAFGKFINGQFVNAASQFLRTDKYRVHRWDVSCDSGCMESGSFAAINGTVYIPLYVSNFRGVRYRLRASLVPVGDARRLGSLVRRAVRADGPFDLLRTMADVAKVTAAFSPSQFETFDGRRLTPSQPCTYLLARDFQFNHFSVVQSFSASRGRRSLEAGALTVQFLNVVVQISPDMQATVDGVSVSGSHTSSISSSLDLVVTADGGSSTEILVRSSMDNVLWLECRRGKACRLVLSSVYFGKVNGALGSPDRNARNDIYGSNDQPQQLWTSC